LTVRAERGDIERSHAAGADDHLLKPFDIGEFLTYIARFEPHPSTSNFTNQSRP
jgi:CheY-like chemotaxis protein